MALDHLWIYSNWFKFSSFCAGTRTMNEMVSGLWGLCYGDGETFPVEHSLHKAPFAATNSLTSFWWPLQHNSFCCVRSFLAPLGPWPLIPPTKMMRWAFPLILLCVMLHVWRGWLWRPQLSSWKTEFLGVEPAQQFRRMFLDEWKLRAGPCSIYIYTCISNSALAKIFSPLNKTITKISWFATHSNIKF